MTARIAWTETRYSHTGSVGSMQLFEISWGTTRGDERPWKLQSRLPMGFKYDGGETIEDAKAAAEKLLARFVAELGAVFQKATP